MNDISNNDTTPAPEASTDAPTDTYTWSPGFIVSNSPYSLRNSNFPISSISIKKPKLKRQMMIKVLSTIPLHPTLFTLFIQSRNPDHLYLQSPTPHIQWKIAIFMPPPPPPKTTQKRQKLQLMIKLVSTIPLPPKLFQCFPKVFCPIPCLGSIQLSVFIENLWFSCHLHRHQKNRKI